MVVTEDRRQKTEDRRQRVSGVRFQVSGIGEQESDGRGRKSEDRGIRLRIADCGLWIEKADVRSWKAERETIEYGA